MDLPPPSKKRRTIVSEPQEKKVRVKEKKVRVKVFSFHEINGAISYFAHIPGLFGENNVVPKELDSIKSTEWIGSSFMGHRIPRVTRWHGPGTYKFGGKKYKPFPYTKVLYDFQETVKSELRKALGAKSRDGLEFKWDFNSVLINKYATAEESISAHADDEPEFGNHPTIVSVSFGSPRKFVVSRMTEKVRQKAWKKRDLEWVPNPSRKPDKMEFVLSHGDCFVMAGSAQDFWVHSVPKQGGAPQKRPRYNLTFRPYAQARP
jgi:alkylated DNA repair dioxygenase AlkB